MSLLCHAVSCIIQITRQIPAYAMSADRPVLLYAHPSMDGLAKAIVSSCDELKMNTSQQV